MKKLLFISILTVFYYSLFSQTINYIPKFSNSLGDINNSIIYQYNNNIGINQTSPSAKLEVRTTETASYQRTIVKLKNETTGDQTSAMTADLDFQLWDSNTRLYNPQARVGVIGSSVANQNDEAGGTLYFSTSISNYTTPSLVERMRITPQGFVGIGTTTPQTTLDINSGSEMNIATFQNSNTGAKIVIMGGESSGIIRNTNNGRDLEFGTYSSTGLYNDDQLFLSDNSRVGVGTSNPTTHFEMFDGTLKVSGGNSYLEDNARFVIDAGPSYAHRFLEFRNTNGVQMVVNGDGHLYAKEIIVTLSSPLGDFVFDDDYNLLSLSELKHFVKQNRHLPGVPSASEVEETGINLGEMDNILLQKIEELTLYVIEQQKLIDELKSQVNTSK